MTTKTTKHRADRRRRTALAHKRKIATVTPFCGQLPWDDPVYRGINAETWSRCAGPCCRNPRRKDSYGGSERTTQELRAGWR
jgi:hypothetical protein